MNASSGKHEYPAGGASITLTVPVRLDAYSSKAFSGLCEKAVEPSTVRFVVLDMSATTYLSSAGVRLFVSLTKILNPRKGQVMLCGLNTYCAEVLEISGLKSLFPVFNTRAEAEQMHRTNTSSPDAWEDDAIAVKVLPGDPDAHGSVEILGNVAELLCANMTEESIASKTFQETEFSIGCGALGDAVEDYFPIMGEMMTIGGTMVWLPTDGHNTPDFLIPKSGSRKVTIRTGFNASLLGGFDDVLMIQSKDPQGISIENLYRALFGWARASRPIYRGVLGMAGRVEFSAVYGAGIKRSPILRYKPANGQTILHPSNIQDWFAGDREPRLKDVTGLLCGIGVDLASDLSSFKSEHVDLAFYRHPDNMVGKQHLLHNHAVFFSPLPWNEQASNLNDEIAAVVEQGDFCDMRHLLDQSRISRALLGISFTQQIRPVRPDESHHAGNLNQ